MRYELICGLETHIELSTKTKIFCACEPKFGVEANVSCCPVCIGLPGTLPVLNENVVKFAVMMGLALGSKINKFSTMERKNYVYPDLPKAYQISQNSNPICVGGKVRLSNGKQIRIHHIHIEEDAGKSVYKNGYCFIDYNRSGTPLIEIVGEPDLRSSEEVKEYIEILQQTAKYLNISDGRMQEGSLRCDVNVSVREVGAQKFGTRVEIKNMNSINFIGKAVEYEFNRQSEILSNKGIVNQETRKYIEENNTTECMRNKEDAIDYRYFTEPDIREINLDEEFIEKIKKSLPELPQKKIERYELLGLPLKTAQLIAKYIKISSFFDEVLKFSSDINTASKLIIGPIFSYLETENKKEEFDIFLIPEDFSYFVNLVSEGKINQNNAKKILLESIKDKKKLREISENFIKNDNEFDIPTFCKKVILENKKAVSDYKNGKEKAFQSLIGTVMKLTKGKANIDETKKILKEFIEKEI